GSVLLKGSLNDYYGQGVETIAFADGTSWTQADLRDKLNVVSKTETHSAIAEQSNITARDVQPRRLYKTEEKRIAELHAKGYGPDGQPLPGTWFPEKKRDLLGTQARMRKEWNEWQDPYFAKHPHKQAPVPQPVSPQRQALRDALAQSIVIYQERLANAAELAPKSPWQRFIGMFTRNHQSEPDSRAFAEMSPLTTDPQAAISEATSLITGASLNTSTLL
ncbi:calcium-binding protein, partial [Brucella intermedia]|uniref:calcium-binding protein n=1 Tax=Brucella intermedia TaxID=94625 RepID=UPI0005BC04FE